MTISYDDMVATGLKLAETQHKAAGAFSVFIREHIQQKNFLVIMGIFNAALAKHGQRSKDNGNVSTPADTVRATVDNVSAALVGTDGYPFEGAMGIKRIDGVYTLYDKGPKEKAPKVNWKTLAGKFKTDAQKRKALEAFAKALGLES